MPRIQDVVEEMLNQQLVLAAMKVLNDEAKIWQLEKTDFDLLTSACGIASEQDYEGARTFYYLLLRATAWAVSVQAPTTKDYKNLVAYFKALRPEDTGDMESCLLEQVQGNNLMARTA